MKTCLYQPIFINPQAYFVFPSLYHIEKGDSFIEPANITGQLIINTLTDDPTLTPIILTVKDNNQVDFSIFAGKHIRISQYTDEGAVVLGEWLMPGEPAPVYPDWFNDSLVCWYSPSKQKLTQLDVIESYAEDFTKGSIETTHGEATIDSQKQITITNILVLRRNIFSFVLKHTDFDLVLYIKGMTSDAQLRVAINLQNSFYEFINLHNGVNKIHIQNGYSFIIEGTVLGECDITITQLPTSILKDFSGNGLDAYMYGFKGKLNSGVGIYHYDFTTFTTQWAAGTPYEKSPNKVIIYNSSTYGSGLWLNVEPLLGEVTYPSFKVRFAGLPEEGAQCRQYYGEDYKQQKFITVYNGDNIIPEWTANVVTSDLGKVAPIEFHLKDIRNEIIIEQIPDYPNQLCYRGKEYCISYNQPILTDYTVITDRTWFDNNGNRVFITKGNIWPNCAFTFEKVNVALNSETFSYSQSTNIDDLIGKSGITYQTKQSYNGKVIGVGTSSDGDILLIGGQLKGEYIGCHSDFLLFNRTLNEDEINWLKENIYNIEI